MSTFLYLMNFIITRFAPSPTGKLHLGNIKIAIFNWLFSKNNKGKFYIRIEDTDYKRSTILYANYIKNELKTLNLNWNSINFQSNNFKYYLKIVCKLIIGGKAFYCKSNNKFKCNIFYTNFSTIMKKPVIVLIKIKNIILLYDNILGKIKINGIEINNIIMVKSNNIPTYTFACTIDDNKTYITHVIRGQDHIVNTFKQIIILKTLKNTIPKYFHVPLIYNYFGDKFSKRNKVFTIKQHYKKGYLPIVFYNYYFYLLNIYSVFYTNICIFKFIINKLGFKKSSMKFNTNMLLFINTICVKHIALYKLIKIIIRNNSFMDTEYHVKNFLYLLYLVKLKIDKLLRFFILCNLFIKNYIFKNQILKKIINRKNLSIIYKLLFNLNYNTKNLIQLKLHKNVLTYFNNVKYSSLVNILQILLYNTSNFFFLNKNIKILREKKMITKVITIIELYS